MINRLVERPTKFLQFRHVLFPTLGTVELESDIVNISAMLEVTQKATVKVLKYLQSEIDSLYIIIKL